ncbi:MAG TPA: AraC family transcriptional regulator [Bacillota bacterium]|nr:AraC family transcriptional regulator [Bacillota bacterium]HOL14756.1 AraC family transcriptional regulator [Bacillota bacterium]HPZ10998.1 AraC family transcriptional regulator [Bacillota bacterium]HQE09784.1 AraC family transcriptional regulator [Bacillota bacterium]
MAEDLKAQVSYLKGLAEGLALDEESKEGKLLLQIVDLLDEMAYEIEDLKTGYEELLEYTEALDEDLGELEDDFYEDHDEDDDDYESFTVECPNCREMVEISDDLLHTDSAIKITCPRCSEIVMIDDEDWEDEDLDELLDAEDGAEEKEND